MWSFVAKLVWVWCQGLVFFPVTSQFFLVDDISGKGMDDSGLSFGGSVFRQKRGVQGRLFPVPAAFFKCLQLKIISVKAVYFGMVCLKLLQSYFVVVYSATFTVHELLLQKNLINSSQWFKMIKNEGETATYQVPPEHQALSDVVSLYYIISSPRNGSVRCPWFLVAEREVKFLSMILYNRKH